MSDNIIEVRDIGKKYIINHQQSERYTALRDVVANKVKNFGKKKLDTGEKEEFWALKDVSFDIKQGDKVGIIGRNGAGKSTLLKLLSRITEPTTGSIKINGRVASLLEVGTGFHPELTGRENIFLNGAILGMSKQEIKKKFDEIVEFAEVEKFLDTPVKRFSSGMYVRLAFSVAAHLEPEILIVDEVLAVGDAQFQKKCLGKMGDVSKEGRTVLFVSHNMGAIQQLCDKGIMLNKGKIYSEGDLNSVLSLYTTAFVKSKSTCIAERKDRKGNQKVRITDIKIYDISSNTEIFEILSGTPVMITFFYESYNPSEIKNYYFHFAISHISGGELIACSNSFTKENIWSSKSNGMFSCKIDSWPLNTGVYSLRFYSEANGEVCDQMADAVQINVRYGDFYKTGAVVAEHLNGVMVEHSWQDGGLK